MSRVKKGVVCCLVAVMAACAGLFSSCALFGWEPSVEDYTPVGTREELFAMEEDGYYRLTADIDMGGQTWTPISLKGFDGGGHTISDCQITGAGFFVDIDTLSNVAFDSVTVLNGYSVAVGGRAEQMEGVSVKNSTVTAAGSDELINKIGLIAGFVKGEIKNCTAEDSRLICSSLDDSAYIGGIAGWSSGGGEKTGCIARNIDIYAANTGYSDTDDFLVGGLFGKVDNGEISDCLASGLTIEADATKSGGVSVGGIAGYFDDYTSLSGCASVGNTIAASAKNSVRMGGVAGISYAETTDCYASGNTLECTSSLSSSSSCYIGGFVASAMNNVKSSFAVNNTLRGNVSEDEYYVAGFTPNIHGAIQNCAVAENELAGGNSDEFAFVSNMIFNCYITDTAKGGNCNGLEELSSQDWFSPDEITQKLLLDETVWTLNAGGFPEIVFE